VGQEPCLILVEDNQEKIESVFTVSDTKCFTKNTTISDGLLDLFALYYLADLTYPDSYKILPFFQKLCLKDDRGVKFSPAMTKLKECF
jgi:hypothetical protein